MNTATMNSYSLNVENAKQAGESNVITEKGSYKGTFSRAEAVTSSNGTQGIEFDFVDSFGRKAQYLTVWTVNKDGKELSGRKIIDAILTCLELRTINAVRGVVMKWDNEQRKEVKAEATIFPDLVGKNVGVLLCREEYENNSGDRKTKNVLVMPFEAESNKTAREKLGRLPAESLMRLVEGLRDRPLQAAAAPRARTGSAPRQEQSGRSTESAGTRFDDMDDDIPF